MTPRRCAGEGDDTGTGDVPPARRCTMPGCEREARDPVSDGSLCDHHATDDSGELEDSTNPTAPDTAPSVGDGDADAVTDTDGEAGSSARATRERGAPTARPSGRSFYPDHIRGRAWWVNWVLARPHDDDGRPDPDATPTKQPVAPYRRGDAEPVVWNFGLPEDDHPCTDYADVRPWGGRDVGLDLHAPDRVESDELGVGIILPTDQGEDRPHAEDARERTVTLLDWDDVRDPETGAIHPVAARALEAVDAYAEVSQSGEGIHQFVFGEIPGGLRKFIRHVDAEPFVGDDRPQIEMYESGRVCAMTGRHVAGSGEDVAAGQDLIDRLCWEYGDATNTATDTPTDPFAADREDTPTGADTGTGDGRAEVPDHDAVGEAIRESQSYSGPPVADWDVPDDRSLEYEAVLRARERSDELAGVANWELIGYAAAFGCRDGLDREDVLDDLRDHPTPSYGYDDSRARKETRAMYRKVEAGDRGPPGRRRLVERGILPGTATGDRDRGRVRAVHLPDDDDLDRAASRTWDWRDADLGDDDSLTVEDAHELTTEAIADAYESADDALIDALPSMGKSFGAVQAAAETDVPVTFLTGRGRKEQYDRIREWAAECGLDPGDRGKKNGDVYLAPAFHRDCETARGDHGEDWKRTVSEWYDRDATPKKIHALADWALDRPLPCEDDGTCRWSRRWDFDPDDFELIVGHYAHGYRPSIVKGRAVVVDEFPEAYDKTFRRGVEGAVTYYLQEHAGLPYSDHTDLIQHRDDDRRRAEALAWIAERGLEMDARGAIDDDGAHALAPYAVFTILATAAGGDDHGNGYESVDLPNGDGVGVYDHGRDHPDGRPAVHLLRPPEAFGFARCVVGLDGTPTPAMWELAVGRRLDRRTILEGRRPEYVEDALGYRLVRTSDAVKPYNNPDHVNTERDAALLEGIADRHGRKPAVVTSATALRTWERDGVIDRGGEDTLDVDAGPVSAAMYHGNVLGSNEFETESLGAVVGSNHYGDGFVKRWGAYAGRAVEREDDTNAGRGAALSYGAFGDRILRHMREHDTLQAVFRFGRDGNGAVVYVDTDTLPDWVPIAGEGTVETWAPGKADVLTALREVDHPTTDAITDHPAVDLARRTAREYLHDLADRGLIDPAPDPEDGRRRVWWPDGVHDTNDHGEVELPAIEAENEAWLLAAKTRSGSTYVVSPQDRADSPPADRGGDVRAKTDGGEDVAEGDPPGDADGPPPTPTG